LYLIASKSLIMEEKIDSILHLLKPINETLLDGSTNEDILIKYGMPILLLIFSFGAKAIIDKEAKREDGIKSLLEVPIELTILSTSLLIAFSAYDTTHMSRNLFMVVLFIITSGGNVFLWSRAIKAYNNKEFEMAKKFGIWNGIVSAIVFIVTFILI